MKEDNSPIIFYQYFATTDLDYFKQLLVKRFRETGHTRDIEFRTWVCDDDKPETDGDIYCYDAFCLKHLVDNDVIQQLPEIIDTSDVFPWVIDTTKVNQKTYGFPWLLCFDALITRRKDSENWDSEENLQDKIIFPLGTYAPLYFYIMSALNMEKTPVPDDEDITERQAYKTIKHFGELTGNLKQALVYHYHDDEVIEAFSSGKKKYIAHFPEIVSSFPDDDYVVKHLNMNYPREDDTKIYYVDFVSVGKNVKEEKLLDCLDIMEIICSPDFIYDICTPNGKPSYMCPALKSLYPKLAKLGAFYNELYNVVKDENNCTVRFKGDYYSTLAIFTKQILDALEKAASESE